MKYVLNDVQTERLSFRLLEAKDFEQWLALFDTGDTARFLGMDPKKTKEELCQQWFDKVFHRYENNLGGMNVLLDKKTGEMVGQCGLLIQELNGTSYMEVGYSLLPAYRGKGYAAEAAQKCRDIAFERGYTESLISIIHIENHASKKVANRNGMSLAISETIFNGMPVNVFKIHKEEWQR